MCVNVCLLGHLVLSCLLQSVLACAVLTKEQFTKDKQSYCSDILHCTAKQSTALEGLGDEEKGKTDDKQRGKKRKKNIWRNKLEPHLTVHFKKYCHFLSSSMPSASRPLIGHKQILKTVLSPLILSYC